MRKPNACGVLIIALSLVALLSPSAVQAARGPSTSEERAKALALVDLLEAKPTAPDAKAAREWLTRWLLDLPDITVTLCLATLSPPADFREIPEEVTVQQAFSQAAFLIRNPQAKNGSVETYLAGVEGALRVYDAMRASDSTPKHKALEELKNEREAGNLETVVRKRAKSCV